MRSIFCLMSAIMLVGGCVQSAKEEAVASDVSGTLIVGNKGENSVSFIDLSTGNERARVDTLKMPHEVAVSPDQKQAAVVAYGGDTIDIFDIEDAKRVERISLSPNKRPHGLLWLDDGRIAATTEGSDTLTIVLPRKNELGKRNIASIATGQKGSHMVVVSPDKRRAFVSNLQSASVTVLDLEKGTKIADLKSDTEPEGIAMTPDGSELWVAARRSNSVHIYDPYDLQEVGKLDVGSVPIRLAISPDGALAVTSNYGSGSLTVIDVKQRKVLREILVSGSADAAQVTIIFSPDGKRIYAAETGHNKIAEVNLDSETVVRRFNVGEKGDGLAVVEHSTQ